LELNKHIPETEHNLNRLDATSLNAALRFFSFMYLDMNSSYKTERTFGVIHKLPLKLSATTSSYYYLSLRCTIVPTLLGM
jgi:hypothetical protein